MSARCMQELARCQQLVSRCIVSVSSRHICLAQCVYQQRELDQRLNKMIRFQNALYWIYLMIPLHRDVDLATLIDLGLPESRRRVIREGLLPVLCNLLARGDPYRARRLGRDVLQESAVQYCSDAIGREIPMVLTLRTTLSCPLDR